MQNLVLVWELGRFDTQKKVSHIPNLIKLIYNINLIIKIGEKATLKLKLGISMSIDQVPREKQQI